MTTTHKFPSQFASPLLAGAPRATLNMSNVLGVVSVVMGRISMDFFTSFTGNPANKLDIRYPALKKFRMQFKNI